MSEKPRRTKTPPPPEKPRGYRATRRGSKALKQAKKAERQHVVATSVQKAGRGAKNVLLVTIQTFAALGFTVLVLLLLATLINMGVRWNAQRLSEKAGSVAEQERRARENFLVIGVEGDKAVGFLAMRIDREGKQVFGIAIPDGAFIDVPGQGFARIGEAYQAGPEAIASAVSNYLTVPFRSYIIVPANVYRDAMSRQVVQGVPESSQGTNLAEEDIGALAAELKEIPVKNVSLIPLPVKPIKLGDQTYFEPQRDQVADLLKTWWGVDPADGERVVRVVVYNGAGKPGIAGEAAQQLIRAGLRVVDTQNADSFDYATTKIVVRRGNAQVGENVRKVLGVGEVTVDESNQDVTDVIVIVGGDYAPPTGGETEGN